jgi:hypothetical protein
LFAVALLIVGVSFPGTAVSASSEAIYQVNSFRVPCVGVGPMSCLQIRRVSDGTDEWQYFYSQIRGFDYEPGFIYRLRVRETELPPEQVPADASAILYELIEVLEKSRDPRFAIHDVWALEQLGEARLTPADDQPRPYVEFNIPRSEYMVTGSCASFRGDILHVDAEELRLGSANVSPLDEVCDDDIFLAEFSTRLASAARWQRDGLSLVLSDDAGATVLTLRKID